MGIKLIVVDDPVAAAIDRMIDAHQRAEAATRLGAPAREMTVLGVGPSDEPPVAPAAPIIAVAFAREPTILGVGTAETPSREASVPFERVDRKLPPGPPTSGQELDEMAEEPEVPLAIAKRGHGGLIVLVLVCAAAAGAYVFRDRLRAEWRNWGLGQRMTTPADVAPPAILPTATPTPTPTPTPMATPTPTSGAGTTSSASPSKRAPSDAALPTPTPPKAKAEQNPY
jgi:hypothetical protein